MIPTFSGYPVPTSNTTYTPNQFFDVVLPNSSRGVVRLVGYMLRKVLGWSDAAGNPQQPQVVVSYRELEEQAGVSHSMIRQALDEAQEFHFIRCLRDGSAHGPGMQAQLGLYELCWEECDRYVTTLEEFRGFYAGNGNLTYIPNAFFDHTLPNETLAVIRVVGTIIRHTIGFQTRYGFRRQEVPMSFTELQRRTGIASPSALNRALQTALEGNHLVRVREGRFDREGGKTSQTAVYAVKWAERGELVLGIEEIAPKSVAALEDNHSEKCSGSITPKSVADHSENCSGNAPKSVVNERSEKCSGMKITHENNSSKQQQLSPNLEPGSVAAVSNLDSEGFQILLTAGFDARTARSLAGRYSLERIQRQCQCLPLRKPAANPLGLLRRAIEEDWPILGETGGEGASQKPAQDFIAHYYAGWAGNEGEPATLPSAAEVNTAEPYLDRLRQRTEREASALGRQFASYAKRESEGNPRATNSFNFVLRLYGEEFYLKVSREEERSAKARSAALRQEHETACRDAYLAWLESHAAALVQEIPEIASGFEEAERADRVKLTRIFPSGSQLLQTTLQDFERAEGRLERLRKYLAKHSPERQLPGFWQWDAEHNPAAFQPAEPTGVSLRDCA